MDCNKMSEPEKQKECLVDAVFAATDRRLTNYFENIEDPDISEDVWKSMNPEDFVYVGYQDDDYERGLYQKYKDYVVSFEAMRNAPKERSQLMTYLLLSKDVPEGCREKAELYRRCIREAFDDSSWPEKTAWE